MLLNVLAELIVGPQFRSAGPVLLLISSALTGACPIPRYDQGMNARITISVPEQVAMKAQRAVDSGYADSVSGYFTDLAEREPDWVEARAAIDELISDAGGLSDEDRRWAASVLDGPPTSGALPPAAAAS
jgi:hypothetical protein